MGSRPRNEYCAQKSGPASVLDSADATRYSPLYEGLQWPRSAPSPRDRLLQARRGRRGGGKDIHDEAFRCNRVRESSFPNRIPNSSANRARSGRSGGRSSSPLRATACRCGRRGLARRANRRCSTGGRRAALHDEGCFYQVAAIVFLPKVSPCPYRHTTSVGSTVETVSGFEEETIFSIRSSPSWRVT